MKIELRDPDVLASLHLPDLVAYLRNRGWRKARQVSEVSAFWELDGGRIVVPITEAIGDYVDRIGDIVAALAQVEGRSPLQIHADMVMTNTDVVRFQLSTAKPARCRSRPQRVPFTEHAN